MTGQTPFLKLYLERQDFLMRHDRAWMDMDNGHERTAVVDI